MYEYYLKGFGGKQFIEKGWAMSQSLKSYEALRDYNTLQFLKINDRDIFKKIESTNTYNFHSLAQLNSDLSKHITSNLFLQTPTIKNIQSRLSSEDLYIAFSFSLNARSFFIVSISKTNFNVYKSKITTFELFNRIAVVKGKIEGNERVALIGKTNLLAHGFTNCESISENLSVIQSEINQVLKFQSKRNLIIENDIGIAQIPFDVLRTPKQVDYYSTYKISYVPNATYFFQNRSERRYKSDRVIGISPTPRKKDEDDEIGGEISLIKENFPNADVIKQCDSKQFFSIIDQGKEYSIFHISSHFNKDTTTSSLDKTKINEREVYLLKLSKKDGYFAFGDSKISVKDIFLHNNSKTRLLILSGCETATSDDFLSAINPLNFQNEDLYVFNESCYCNKTMSFDNLILMGITFNPEYIIAFQNAVLQEYSWKFFNEFYQNMFKTKDVNTAFYKTKRDLMSLNDKGYYHYASIILIRG